MRVLRIFSLALSLMLITTWSGVQQSIFAVEAPAFTIVYKGRISHNDNTALNVPHEFRFSLWSSADWQGTDTTGEGNIDTDASSYSGWEEVQMVTPSSNGFFAAKLGAVTPFPLIDYRTYRFLQVEVRLQSSIDAPFQLMDPTSDAGADLEDRRTLNSPLYSFQAESAENSLGDTFILDKNNTRETEGNGLIKLQFGDTLGKFLAYDVGNGYFVFNDDLHIAGDLTVSGLINGVDITSLAGGHAQNTDSGTNADTFAINNDANGIVLDTQNLTGTHIITFDDGNTLVVGTTNTQTLTNKTLDGDDNTLQDIPLSALKDRNKTLLLTPEYANRTIHGDGTDNIANMYEGYDTVAGQPYYLLSSEQPTLQDMDVYITVPIPDDFVSFQATPLQIFLRSLTTASSENQIDLTAEDSVGGDMTLIDSNDLTSAGADTWSQKTITISGTPTITPGGSMLLKLKLQAHSGNKIYLGTIQLNYVGK